MGEVGDRVLRNGRISIYRHPGVVRLTHWLNVLAITALLTSGMQIYNAHPALYWGEQSTFETPWLAFGEFPDRFTLPPFQSLGTARHWHFTFAWLFLINGLLYVGFGALSGRLGRVMIPRLRDLRGIGATIREHARLHFPKGEEARRYNVLQQLTYLAVIFVLLPLLILTGLTMSPGFNAGFPVLLDLFGGRQSARSLHFIAAALLVGFIVLHVALVVIAGFWNHMRSMITGRYNLEPDAPPPPDVTAAQESAT